MRKRSEVAAPDPRQQPLPGVPTEQPTSVTSTAPSGELPAGCEVQDNVFFIKCSDCGMHQGFLMTKRDESGVAHCFRCNKPFDPIITPDYVDSARARWRESRKKANGNASPPQGIPLPPSSGAREKCAKCGVDLTITSLGRFWPCGHDPSSKAGSPAPASAKLPAPTPTTVDVKQEFKAHPSDAVTKAMNEKFTSDIVKGSGERIVVHHGRELFQPKQFNTFEVGPFQYETTVRAGETVEQAFTRATEELRRFAAIEFKRKAEDYLRRLQELGEMIGKQGS